MLRTRPTALPSSLTLVLLLAGCAGKGADSATPSGGENVAQETAPQKPAINFENPGGMWMPGQMTAHAETLKSLGLAYDPAALTDPTAFPLGAIVSLGGCSASFVSPEGLIVTNHHCVTRYLQANSTPENNLLDNGFLAKTRADEKSGGPAARVFVTTAFTDVSDKVLGGLEGLADDKRAGQIEDRRKQLVGACEGGRTGVRCTVASFYEGAQFFQIEQTELRDVRLVYAPHEGIGVFGGDIDNWRWPRHTGDFSFLRAYVGKDGAPADFSPENVPYKPKHFLKVATDKATEGSLVMVAGYPGRTQRLKTAAEAQQAADWYYSRQIQLYEELIAVMEGVGKQDPKAVIAGASRLRGLNNYLLNFRGMRDGLVKGGVAADKARIEGELQKWIEGDEARKAKYGDVLAQMAALTGEKAKTRERDAAHDELVRGSLLLSAADTIVRLADERAKPDEQRRLGMQSRDERDLEQSMQALQANYHPDLDRAVFRLYLQRAAKLPEADRPEVLTTIVGKKGTITDNDIDRALDKLYKGTKLGDAVVRLEALRASSAKTVKASTDPFIKLAAKLKPIVDEHKKQGEAATGAMVALRPRYIEALRAYHNGSLAPDANSTLRVTFGTIRGYSPSAGAAVYKPFTSVSEMVKKNTGEEPFAAPKAALDAIAARKFGPYTAPEVGEVPVNFLADLDITGGNSGSATLNAKGELTGLVFDGNIEAMASDWVFMPPITRSIHVDIRYVLWVMDAVDGADHLLTELGVTPSI
ncbi:S46 family peptidase [Nannocystis pusilla]|uniref:Dipeptidyl-peptidase n=1 Tax=Nannocystis pusilla TaxID=889268 RepID=A0ABS7TQ39_9BACT|nr:S46 family peptidase [Nannocystis pusilla]MBZ5710347.1 S46 family peptidase [Nannocystis pusilla]